MFVGLRVSFKKGDILVLAAFGAGFSWGSVLLKWGYDIDIAKNVVHFANSIIFFYFAKI